MNKVQELNLRQMLKLELPNYDYLLKKIKDKLCIYDIVRKKYIVLTPEEWVRQHFINYLINYKGISPLRISLENAIKYNKLSKRADIVVYNDNLIPFLLIECKAPTVAINVSVIEQLSIYNYQLNCEIIGVSNGITHIFWKKNKLGSYLLLDSLPENLNH